MALQQHYFSHYYFHSENGFLKDFRSVSCFQHIHHLPGEDTLKFSGRCPPGLATPSGDDTVPEVKCVITSKSISSLCWWVYKKICSTHRSSVISCSSTLWRANIKSFCAAVGLWNMDTAGWDWAETWCRLGWTVRFKGKSVDFSQL